MPLGESFDSLARKMTMMLEKTKRHFGVTMAEAAEGSDIKKKVLRQECTCGIQVTMERRMRPRRVALKKAWSLLAQPLSMAVFVVKGRCGVVSVLLE